MGRALVAAAGFAIAGGLPADSADLVFVARLPDRFGRLLLAAVEPLDASPRGREIAGVALRVMRETFAATPGAAGDALLAAFAAANMAVLVENRLLAAGRPPRRLCVGATGIALAGREIVVAQAPPAQAVLAQDGQIYAFPDIASWRGDYAPDTSPEEGRPLGFAEYELPQVYQSEAAAGDLIALCSTSAGRTLGRDDAAVVDLFGGTLLTLDLEGSVDRLERLLSSKDIGDAYAVVASISRLGGRSFRSLPRRRSRNGSPAVARTSGAAQAAAGADAGMGDQAPAAGSSEARPRFEGLRDWVIELSEIASMQQRGFPASYLAPRPALAAPGAMSVQRYRDSTGLPAEWRANLPRGPGLPMPSRLLALSLVLFLTLGGTGLAVGRQRDRAAHAEQSLAAADTALRYAAENPGMAMSAIAEAETALATARAEGASAETLRQHQQELVRVRDTVWRVERLTEVTRIGALPVRGSGGSAHLALAGRTLYIAAGDLYELDREAGRLVLLLAGGDTIPGGMTGDLRHVSIDGGHVVVSDGEAMFARDETGGWQRHPLAVADVGGLRVGAPLISWGEAAYGLSWEGDIVRFDRSAGGSLATRWATAAEHPDLEIAQDLLIDGRIHVLLADGRVLTFSRGALAGTSSPFVVPMLTEVAFLADAPFANVFYVVDRTGRVGENSGRIVRVDAAGDARQYVAPPPIAGDPLSEAAAASLAGAEDVAIDELSRMVYWVSAGELWQATLPSM